MAEESTAHDLIRLTREVIEAQGTEATMRFFGPRSAYDLSHVGLGVFEGDAAIRRFLDEWGSAYDDEKDAPEEVIGLGNRVVYAVVRGEGRPAGSPDDVRVHARRGVVIAWRDALIERVTVYTDIDEARAAAERLAEEQG